MISLQETRRSLLISIWFMFLTFPILVIKVNPLEQTIDWRWKNMVFVGIGSFILSIIGRILMARGRRWREKKALEKAEQINLAHTIMREPKYLYPLAGALLVFAMAFPHLFSSYQTNVMTTALMYVSALV
jgi:branched-chain amino acid transport system permease protein